MNRYQKMTNEELKELAVQKVKKTGLYKKTALRAQRELWERNNWGDKEENVIDDGFCDRNIEDIQYHGEVEVQ